MKTDRYSPPVMPKLAPLPAAQPARPTLARPAQLQPSDKQFQSGMAKPLEPQKIDLGNRYPFTIPEYTADSLNQLLAQASLPGSDFKGKVAQQDESASYASTVWSLADGGSLRTEELAITSIKSDKLKSEAPPDGELKGFDLSVYLNDGAFGKLFRSNTPIDAIRPDLKNDPRIKQANTNINVAQLHRLSDEVVRASCVFARKLGSPLPPPENFKETPLKGPAVGNQLPVSEMSFKYGNGQITVRKTLDINQNKFTYSLEGVTINNWVGDGVTPENRRRSFSREWLDQAQVLTRDPQELTPAYIGELEGSTIVAFQQEPGGPFDFKNAVNVNPVISHR